MFIKKGRVMPIIQFTDIHYGKYQNSERYLQDCFSVINETVKMAAKADIKTCVFLGDWFNDRVNINSRTLHYSVKGLRALNDGFDVVYVIAGNHDLFYKNSRCVSSIEFAKEFPNITVVDQPVNTSIDGIAVSIVPWLTSDDDVAQTLHNMTGEYLFCHAEFRSFKYNQNSVMLTDGLPISAVEKFKKVYTGHYHLRQDKKNIQYIGSIQQQDFGDAGTERGWTILDLKSGKEAFIENNTSPRFHKIALSKMADEIGLVKDNYIRVVEDMELKSDQFAALHQELVDRMPVNISFETVRKRVEEDEVDIDVDGIDSVDSLLIQILEEQKGRKLAVKILGDHL